MFVECYAYVLKIGIIISIPNKRGHIIIGCKIVLSHFLLM